MRPMAQGRAHETPVWNTAPDAADPADPSEVMSASATAGRTLPSTRAGARMTVLN